MITQAQQEFTSRLVQNVRYPLSIMEEDEAMNTIKLAMALLVAAGVAATPFAAQAKKYRPASEKRQGTKSREVVAGGAAGAMGIEAGRGQ